MKPLDHAKKMAREFRKFAAVNSFSHSSAQAATARILGYRDWHHLNQERSHQPGDHAGRHERVAIELAIIKSSIDPGIVSKALFPELPAPSPKNQANVPVMGGIHYTKDTADARAAMASFAKELGLPTAPSPPTIDYLWRLPRANPEDIVVYATMDRIMGAIARLADRPGYSGATFAMTNEAGEFVRHVQKTNGLVLQVSTIDRAQFNALASIPADGRPGHVPFLDLDSLPDESCHLIVDSDRPIHPIVMETEIDFEMFMAGLAPGHDYKVSNDYSVAFPAKNLAHCMTLATCIDGSLVSKYGITFRIDQNGIVTDIALGDVARTARERAAHERAQHEIQQAFEDPSPLQTTVQFPEYGGDIEQTLLRKNYEGVPATLRSIFADMLIDDVGGHDFMAVIKSMRKHVTKTHPVLTFEAFAGDDDADVIHHHRAQSSKDLINHAINIPMLSHDTYLAVTKDRYFLNFMEGRTRLIIVETKQRGENNLIEVAWFVRDDIDDMTLTEQGLFDSMERIGTLTDDPVDIGLFDIRADGNFVGKWVEPFDDE